MSDTTQPGADNALDLDKLEALALAADTDVAACARFTTTFDPAGVLALIALARRAAQPVEPAAWLMLPSRTTWVDKHEAEQIMAACKHQTELLPLYLATHPSEPAEPAVGGALVTNAEPIMFGESPVENMEIDLLCHCLSESTMFDGKGLEAAWNQLVSFYVAHRSGAAPTGSAAAPADLRTALKDVTDVLDIFGNLGDGQMCPRAWNAAKAEEKIKAARALLATNQPIPTKGNGDTDKGEGA